MNYALTIIVPVYNEQDNLQRLEKELLKYLAIAVKPACVLLVNDGSTDESLAMMKEICQRNTDFSYLSFVKNCGLSAAIKAGFDTATTPWVGYIDSDLQTDPEDFNSLLAHAETHALVTGVRANRKDSFVKNMSS
ncbi:MAG: glycosyltransferase, partial [Flavobacteriaceae bacterium]|nr:glycosyltransferase [Flavobacteriaceae bacterium]